MSLSCAFIGRFEKHVGVGEGSTDTGFRKEKKKSWGWGGEESKHRETRERPGNPRVPCRRVTPELPVPRCGLCADSAEAEPWAVLFALSVRCP